MQNGKRELSAYEDYLAFQLAIFMLCFNPALKLKNNLIYLASMVILQGSLMLRISVLCWLVHVFHFSKIISNNLVGFTIGFSQSNKLNFGKFWSEYTWYLTRSIGQRGIYYTMSCDGYYLENMMILLLL